MNTKSNNNLQDSNPNLAKEWHPAFNGSLTPKDVKPKSNKKVWWRCSRGHEWQAVICDRSVGNGCPVCSGKIVHNDNCLATINPTLAAEWHPTNNHPLTPNDLTPNARKKIWWRCKKGHEWQAYMYNRSIGGNCPYCNGKKVNIDNCLATMLPDIAKEWDHDKNHPRTPYDVTHGSGVIAWWKCKFGHSWKTSICNRKKGTKCPYCSNQTSEIELAIYAELKVLFAKTQHRKKIGKLEVDIYIEEHNLAVEFDGNYWHKDKLNLDKSKNIQLNNSGITVVRIRDVGLISTSINDLLLTGSPYSLKHHLLKKIILHILNFVPVTTVELSKYKKEDGLVGVSLYKTLIHAFHSKEKTNSLVDVNKNLAATWHPTLNGLLRPCHFTAYSHYKAWWVCAHGHTWLATIAKRSIGRGCPDCYRYSKKMNKIEITV